MNFYPFVRFPKGPGIQSSISCMEHFQSSLLKTRVFPGDTEPNPKVPTVVIIMRPGLWAWGVLPEEAEEPWIRICSRWGCTGLLKGGPRERSCWSFQQDTQGGGYVTYTLSTPFQHACHTHPTYPVLYACPALHTYDTLASPHSSFPVTLALGHKGVPCRRPAVLLHSHTH